jgi:hypothetical protein
MATSSLGGGEEKNDRAAGASPFIPPRTQFAPNAATQNSQPVDIQAFMVGWSANIMLHPRNTPRRYPRG